MPGCARPKVYYNIYLLKGNGQTLKQIAVSTQTAYGAYEFQVEAGVDYTIMVKNWDDQNAETEYTINTYSDKSKITL